MHDDDDGYWKRISDKIPSDTTDQFTSRRLLTRVIGLRTGLSILDLGCGDGRAVDWLRKLDQTIDYRGADIEKSPEVISRTRTDALFDTYNGRDLPYKDERFDIVFSNQVFEHVEQPGPLLRDVARVLKPAGIFCGSVSQLEPYHSYSLWNYTIYGWDRLLEANGLRVTEFRPGIDGITLIMRSIDGQKRKFSQFFDKDSPIHRRIERKGRLSNISQKQINHRKIVYSGHFLWIAEKHNNKSDQERLTAIGLE